MGPCDLCQSMIAGPWHLQFQGKALEGSRWTGRGELFYLDPYIDRAGNVSLKVVIPLDMSFFSASLKGGIAGYICSTRTRLAQNFNKGMKGSNFVLQ